MSSHTLGRPIRALLQIQLIMRQTNRVLVVDLVVKNTMIAVSENFQ